jgi:hypothetical protein
MKRSFSGLLLVLLLATAGCSRTTSIYESDDLVSIIHNNATEYTLLVYQDTAGRSLQVLRRKGICELMLIELGEGDYLLKEQGRDYRKLSSSSVVAIRSHMEELVLQVQRTGVVARRESTL